MNFSKHIFNILTGAMLLAPIGAAAASVEEATILAEDGNLAEAIAMLQELEAAAPKDANIPKLLGDYLAADGQPEAAREAYGVARKKGNRMAILALAELALSEYRTDEARTLTSDYRASLRKGKKVLAEDESGDIDERISRIDNMLGRVEQIQVIDSMIVDADDFFRYYRLSPECGSLNSPDILPDGFEAADPTVVFEPENKGSMIWAAPMDNNTFGLFSSSALYGNEWETPVSLGDNLADGGDANFPFMMPDGMTLYFASDGDNSIGGLDLFIARRGDEGFLQPQNLGFPYNSPYDDYMLAIDEMTGVGWWATDRNRIPGKVTIYLFIPSDLRKNVSPDSPELRSRALLDNISLTWEPETNRKAIIERVLSIQPDLEGGQPQFMLSVPGRGVLTRFEQFHSPRSRQAMQRYLQLEQKFKESQASLAKMREQYARGNRSQSSEITRLEQSLEKEQVSLRDLRNEIISLESN